MWLPYGDGKMALVENENYQLQQDGVNNEDSLLKADDQSDWRIRFPG